MARTRSTSSSASTSKSSSAVRTSSTAGLPYASPLSRPSGHDSPVARRLSSKITGGGKLSDKEKDELKKERNRNKQRAYRDRIENQITALDAQNHQLESISSNQAALILSLKHKINSLQDQLAHKKAPVVAGSDQQKGRSSLKASPSEAAADGGSIAQEDDESRTSLKGSPPPLAAASLRDHQSPRLIFRPNDGSPPIDLYAQEEEEEEEEEEMEMGSVEMKAAEGLQVEESSRGLEKIEEIPDEEMELARDGDGEDGTGSGLDTEEEDEVEDAFNDEEEMESSISPLSFEPNNPLSLPSFINPHHLHRPSSANSDTFILNDDFPSQYGSPTASISSSSSDFAINPSDFISSKHNHNHYHYDYLPSTVYQTSNGYHHSSELASSPLQPLAHHNQNDASSSSNLPFPQYYHHQSFTQDINHNVPPLPNLPPIIHRHSSSSSSSSSVQHKHQPTSSRTDAPAPPPLSRLRPRVGVVIPPSTASTFSVATRPSISNVRGGRRWAPFEMDESSGSGSEKRRVGAAVKVEEDEETKRPEWRESGKGMLTRKRTSLGYQYC